MDNRLHSKLMVAAQVIHFDLIVVIYCNMVVQRDASKKAHEERVSHGSCPRVYTIVFCAIVNDYINAVCMRTFHCRLSTHR